LISQNQHVLGVDIIHDIFPSPDEVNQMLRVMPSDPIHSSLAVLDPLLPPPSVYRHAPISTQIYDNRGYSAYARLVCALLQVSIEDRQAARRNFWALRHFLALSIYADDLLQIPTASSAAFQQNTSGNDLHNIITTVHQITTYLLTSPMNRELHLKVITAVCEDRSDVSLGGLGGFLADFIASSKHDDNVMDSRILRRILQPVLSDVSMYEADQWMILARRLEKTGVYYVNIRCTRLH
jgi:E3 ubiquitin-protein ligase listerin